MAAGARGAAKGTFLADTPQNVNITFQEAAKPPEHYLAQLKRHFEPAIIKRKQRKRPLPKEIVPAERILKCRRLFIFIFIYAYFFFMCIQRH